MADDMERLDEIYRFCVLRASEGAAAARGRRDWDKRRNARRTLRILLEMRLSVLNSTSSAAATTESLRWYARRNRDHPDFRPEWAFRD
jgi:hypothetical protein